MSERGGKKLETFFKKAFFVELLSSAVGFSLRARAALSSFGALNQRTAPSVLIPGQSQAGSLQR